MSDNINDHDDDLFLEGEEAFDDMDDAYFDDALDDDFSGDTWGEDEAVVGGDATLAAPPPAGAASGKKKLPMFNVAVIGGAVLLGAFMMMRTFGGGGAPVDQMQQVAQDSAYEQSGDMVEIGPQGAPRGPANQQNTQAAGAQSDGGFMNDPAAFQHLPGRYAGDTYGQAQPVTAPPMPAPFTQPDATQDALTPLPGEQSGMVDDGHRVVGIDPFTQKADPHILAPDNLVEANADRQLQSPAMPEISAPARLADPGATIESQTAQMHSPAHAPALPSVQSSGQIAGGDDRLDRILARMDKIDARLDGLEGAVQEVGVLRRSVEDLEKQITHPAPAQTAKQAAKKATAKAPSSTKAPAPAKPKAKLSAHDAAYVPPRAAAPVWTLRSAQNGRAYVAKAGQNDVTSVAVGDQLPGLGRIVAVEQRAGRWVVVGTSGQIEQ